MYLCLHADGTRQPIVQPHHMYNCTPFYISANVCMGYYTCKICQSPIRLSREAGKQTNIDHRQVAGELKKTNATFGKLEDLCGAKSGR